MAMYTPGALSAIFDNSKNDNSDINEKSSDKLVQLFTKKIPNKHASLNISNNEQLSGDAVKEASNKKKRSTDKNNKIKSESGSNLEDIQQIGPIIIPSNAQKIDEDDEEINEVKPKYSRPSRKYQVIEEDKKKSQFDSEKESRTVFVGNVPNNVSEKILRRKFKEYGEIETVRIRSVARPDMKTTKKLAFIKKTFHESRNNANAYIRFKDIDSAQKSCKLNGTEIDSHVIRVDIAEKRKSGNDESKTQEHDQSKAVFLGNVKFNEQEDNIRRHFEKCGNITDVRLVRDTATGIGKGFGYVNFETADAVEKAIRLNGTALNERTLRVSRAVNRPKKTITLLEKKTHSGVFKPKVDKGQKKKSFLKISKEKQKSLTSHSYQGKHISKNNDKKSKSKKKFNKNERRKSAISKKLSQPKKTKTPKLS